MDFVGSSMAWSIEESQYGSGVPKAVSYLKVTNEKSAHSRNECGVLTKQIKMRFSLKKIVF
jgi:hypothetical protein